MTDSAQPPILDHARLAAISSLFKDLPEGFEERHAALKAIRDEFHAYLARSFEPALNKYAQQLPQETLDEKRQTASAVNGLLRSVGLTIRSDSGRPALLVVDTLGPADHSVTRFRLEWRDEEKKIHRTNTKEYLTDLTLMQEHPRLDFWAKRLQRGQGSPDR